MEHRYGNWGSLASYNVWHTLFFRAPFSITKIFSDINRTVKIQVSEAEPASDELIQESDSALPEIYVTEDKTAWVKPAFLSLADSEIILVNSSSD